MADDGWDLRSNIKNKPGSQGTLFRAADKGLLNPQQRWPKGYTPERLGEVREALHKIPITHPDRMENEHEPGDYREIMGYRERAVRTVAKSTVPTKHLEGLREIHGEPEEGHDATYWPGKKTIGVDLTQPESDKDLVHELGHHHDYEHSLNLQRITPQVAEKHAWKDKGPYQARPTGSGIAQAHNKVQAGVAEATADNYYTEHYRSGGRKSVGDSHGRYEENFTPQRLDEQYPGYTDVRPRKFTNLSSVQFQGNLF